MGCQSFLHRGMQWVDGLGLGPFVPLSAGDSPQGAALGAGRVSLPPSAPQGKGKMRTYWLLGERKDPKVV